MKFFIVLDCWQHEGCDFQGLYTTLQKAVDIIEKHLLKSDSRSHYYEILQVEPDNLEFEEIEFREEGKWRCECGVEVIAGVGGYQQTDFYDTHRDKLQHNIEFLGITGKIILDQIDPQDPSGI